MTVSLSIEKVLIGTLLLALLMSGCGGSTSGASASLPDNNSVVTSPVIATAVLPDATELTNYAASLQASGGVPPYTWKLAASSSLPAGISFDSSQGSIKGVPEQLGTFNLDVTVMDARANTQSKDLKLSITQKLLLTGGRLGSATANKNYTTAVNAKGGTTPYTFRLAAGSLPQGLTLQSNGTITGVPTSTGTATFDVAVTDTTSPAQSAKNTYSLDVSPAVTSLAISTAAVPNGNVGTAYSANLSAIGGTSPYAWTVSSGSLPAGLQLSAGGAIQGTPTSAGSYSFTIKLTDAGTPTPQVATTSFAMTIATPAAALAISTVAVPNGILGTAYSSSLTGTGGVTPYTWRISSGVLPTGLVLSSEGILKGAPTSVEEKSFVVEVKDSSATPLVASKSFSLLVAAPALAITTASLPGAQLGAYYKTEVSAIGGSAPYTWSVVGGLPPGLTLAATTGALTGTASVSGSYSFSLKLTDNALTSLQRQFTIVVSSSPYDQYGGLRAVPAPGGASGYFRTEKIGNRWVFVTPEGNSMFSIGASVVAATWATGTDEAGNNYRHYVDAKYAFGNGPKDGFTSVLGRWAYYTRERLRSWGFNTIGTFSYYPAVPNYLSTGVQMPETGNVASNLMPHWITQRNAADAMTAGVKNIYGPVYSKFNNPFFPDAFDPAFESFLAARNSSLLPSANSPWVLGVFMEQTDQMRGVESTHPHLGFVIAATNFAMASDPKGYNGAKTYTDTKMYSKLALRDFLMAKYTTIDRLNAAWGTSYTTWGDSGGWGTGTGFLDENGSHLGTWTSASPSKAGYPAVFTDLDSFAATFMRKFYSLVYGYLRKSSPHHLIMTNNMDHPKDYVYAGLKSLDGTQVYADLIEANVTVDPSAAYLSLNRPFFPGIPYATAENDSPMKMKGTIDAFSFDESDPRGANYWTIKVTCNECNFWWAGNASYKISYPVTVRFSGLPDKIPGRTSVQYYKVVSWNSPTQFTVNSYGYASGTYADLKAVIAAGQSFRRIALFHPEGPFETQEARGLGYSHSISAIWNQRASNGDYFCVGTGTWAWMDEDWLNYFEAYNFGLVTLRDNAYDGTEATTATGMDRYGFPTGGETGNYGNFLSTVKSTNKSIEDALIAMPR